MNSIRPNQGKFLLEEWPTSGDRTHSLIVDWPHVDPSSIKKSVSFSEYSEVKVMKNHSYKAKKSYSKYDVDFFKYQISREASRIENLISRFNSKSTGRAIHSALEWGFIKHEDLIGLEHLVTAASREEYVNVRKYHSALVLRAQKLLRDKREDSDKMAAMMLAKAASISSTRCAKKAMLRAEMSIQATKKNHRQDSLNGFGSKTSPEKHAHFRVPSVDSLKVARARNAEAKSGRAKAAFAA